MRRLGWTIGLALSLIAALGTGTAAAAFPGANGQLAIQPVSGPGLILATDTGAGAHRICTDVAVCGYPGRPEWAPDGRELVFAGAARPGRSYGPLKVVAPDGSCVDCLFGTAVAPSFAPTGQLANPEVSFLPGSHTVGLDSLDRLGIANISIATIAGAPTDAIWSSHGRLVVVSGGRIWQLATSGRSDSLITSGESPDWSPSGTGLAFMRDGWIWIHDMSTGRNRRLVPGASPTYAPNGQSVAFIGTGHRVEVIPAAGGRAREVGSLTGRSVDWQPEPSAPRPACTLPSEATSVLNSPQALVFTQTAYNTDGQFYDAAIMGCLQSEGITRALEFDTDSSGPDSALGLELPVVSGDYLALLIQGVDDHYGGGSEQVGLYDLATGLPGANANPLGAECVGTGPGDQDVTPSSSCGINGLAVAPNGDYAVEETNDVPSVDCGSGDTSSACWEETITDHTTTGVHVLASLLMDAPTGQSGLTDLTASGDILSWEDNGTPESATF